MVLGEDVPVVFRPAEAVCPAEAATGVRPRGAAGREQESGFVEAIGTAGDLSSWDS